MSDMIRVNTDLLERCANELKAAAQGFGDAASILARLDTSEEWWESMGSFSTLRLADTGTSVQMGNAGAAVRALTGTLRSYDERLTRLGNNMSAAADLFSNTESEILGRIQGQNAGEDPGAAGDSKNQQTLTDSLITALGYPKNRDLWTNKMRDQFREALENGSTYVTADGVLIFVTGTMTIARELNGDVMVYDKKWDSKTVKTYGADGSYSESTTEIKFGSMFAEDKAERPNELFNYNKKDGYSGKDDRPSREQTLFSVGVEAARSKSLWHKDGKIENGLTTVSGSVDLMKASSTARVELGLYNTKVDKNGNEIHVLEPGISAEMGASFSMFEAKAEGKYGTENLNVHTEVQVKGPGGSAQVSGELGYVDGRVAAHVGVSGEIIGGEVGGEVGVNVGGLDATVKGTVNYGIGGHADVGMHDGKFSCDVGLSVGVGASVKFEVDYGQFAENVVSATKDAYDNAKNTVNTIKNLSQGLFKW